MARKPADQAVNRIDILSAAADVFRRKGYHGAKMADIAAEVKLTAGSLYHHFPDGKQQILMAVLNDGLEQITDNVREIVNDPALQPDEQLRRIVYEHILGLTEHVSIAAALVFETRTLLNDLDNTDARQRYLDARDRFELYFRQVVESGIEKGMFHPVDVAIFTKTMLGAHNWVGVWYRDGGRLSGEEIAEEMAETFLRALRR
ncbi:MAG: TetR/AcrR family transcriptional regulator [Chloroflexi bacterium]|nr:TetR/AcrR family transcriptional regulator [Chloroflexota bacterium]